MRKKDLLWFLAFPVYLTIGTIRHEAAHALFAQLQGARITEFVFLPGFRGGQLYFGYVNWIGGEVTWVTTAAPYFIDLLTFALFFGLCCFVPFKRHWLWFNLVILGMVSPLVNSAYQYFKPGLFGSGDIGWLLEHLQPGGVHAYMLFTIGLYLAGLWFAFTRSSYVKRQCRQAAYKEYV